MPRLNEITRTVSGMKEFEASDLPAEMYFVTALHPLYLYANVYNK